jgi:serine/threonine protein kinase
MTKNINVRKSISPKTKDLLKKLLTIDDAKRIDIDDVLNHPAMKDNLKEF